MSMPLIFEKSKPGRKAYSLPELDVPKNESPDLLPDWAIRKQNASLPEISEVDLVRHYTELSRRNFGVDQGFYPLGSCTMKYNPKVNEDVAALSGFNNIHPYQPEELVQGALQLMYEFGRDLCEISGMHEASLQPAAGAHGELTGLMLIRAYHESRGEGKKRTKVIVPDSAHGTNPASAAFCGYRVVEVKSDEQGGVNLDSLREVISDDVAALMLTNPNTLGLFDENVTEIAEIVHNAGGLLYYDGANMNAIVGVVRPGDMGFDVLHYNVHKTFSTPHGGGGPGCGAIAVKKILAPFLPVPVVDKQGDLYTLNYDRPQSIGMVKGFYGNFNVMVKGFAYIRSLGAEGLRRVAETAVLNANYIMRRLEKYYNLPYDRHCKHEFVIDASRQLQYGVHTNDIAKALLDLGFHAPTVYFPLIVREAMMIEPTETESKETLDAFIEAMIEIAQLAETSPEKLQTAPHNTVVGRLDDVTAARRPILRWTPPEE
ncbi:MAG TPA: aminomethyl-transferring glycine dehydrogenase subunit GcvPB [Firmicutes bacterium]|jgi:glycine dehydrogenase subunit 2|nr:aminomethyl-transferring glycine dehydrogenase subunit GcvPB [Bacillota bacterium]